MTNSSVFMRCNQILKEMRYKGSNLKKGKVCEGVRVRM